MLRTVMGRANEKLNDLLMCFSNFEKAFDTIQHELFVEQMKSLLVEAVDLRVLTNLY